MIHVPEEFQIFIKPVGPTCNLACSYCYYIGKSSLYPKPGKMDDTTLDRVIREQISISEGSIISFSWHGGEPLLAGLPFYKKALEIQEKYRPAGKIIINGIQTNGTLINDAWCSFFSENNFVIGISIDGPGHLHDVNRLSAGGGNSFSMTIRGLELLLKYGIETEILCVVNAVNSLYPIGVYDFLKSTGVKYLSFLPLVERENGSNDLVTDKSVNPLQFGLFLSAVFDEWLEKDIGRIKIQVIEEALRSAFGQEHTLCIFRRECGAVPVLERDGSFYSCDHYVDSSHLLGNINDLPLASLIGSGEQRSFGKMKKTALPGVCRECDVLPMCNGECPKNRILITSPGEPGLNYLCEGYKYFFRHCRPFAEAVAEEWKRSSI